MEKSIKVKTSDNHLVYGTLNYSKPSKDLIIFVHGLTGHKNEHIFYNAVKFFNKKGFATFRLDLYSDEDKARNLADCSIRNHVEDIDLVVKYFSRKYTRIFLVGHSLAGPTIILSNQLFEKIVLWDPSIGLHNLFKGVKYEKTLRKYILSWGIQVLISEEMFKESKRIKNDELIEKISKPIKIICAGKGILWKRWKSLIDKIKVKKEFIVIKNATHCFDEENTEGKLFEETLKWFMK